jgi:hypothetical protein
MKHDAIGASYPVERVDSESVGLKEMTTETQNAKYFRLELRNLVVKK